MRNIRRQKQGLWFCDVTEVNDGIDLVKRYSKPEKHRATVSATSGYVNGWGAGFVLNYDRYITNFDRDFKPHEGMMVFVDVVPYLDSYGGLVTTTDKDGNVDYVTPPDYMLKRVYDTRMGKIARYGLEKV